MSGHSGYENRNNSRVEPDFFNLNKDRNKKFNTTSDADENAYWSSLPPPYTPTSPSSSSEPSAPPLDPEYPQQQQQQYPPQGYNQYPQYGSMNPMPHNNNNNNNNTAGWPWRAPHPSNNNGITPTLPPGIPPYEVASAEPSRSNKKCSNLIFFLIPLFIFLVFFQFFGNINNSCRNGVQWEALPRRFDFDSRGLTFRVTGGHVSRGTVTFKREQEKSGVIELDAVLSPQRLLDDPQLGYHLVRGNDGTTSLEITLPSSFLASNSHCISLNTVIYLPYDAPLEFLNLEMKNMQFETDQDGTMDVEHLVLQSANSPISFDSRWRGKTMLLATTNARIDVSQPIESEDTVTLETKNGRIRIRETIQAKNSILLSSTNAAIDSEKLLSASSLTVATTNGRVELNKVKVDRAHVQSTNGPIQIRRGDITTISDTKTSNGRLDVNLKSCPHCRVVAETSNANLKLVLPENHEGPFNIVTSGYNSVEFNDRLAWSKFHEVQPYHVSGDRYRIDNNNHTGGEVQAKTSNGNAYLSFGSE